MKTETIYARIPVPVKEALDAYASEHGMSITRAVADLISRELGVVSARTTGRQPENLWCAECLYDLRGRNGSLHQFSTDEEMFTAIEANDTVRGMDRRTLTPRAVTMWQGTPICMDHLRMKWKP